MFALKLQNAFIPQASRVLRINAHLASVTGRHFSFALNYIYQLYSNSSFHVASTMNLHSTVQPNRNFL